MEKYIEEKMEVLKDFGIALTWEQKKHLKTLTSQVAIDNYIRGIIAKRLDRYNKIYDKIYRH